MTVREKILDVLYNADRPLSQVEIATRGVLVDSSVRRECQMLEKNQSIVVKGFNHTRENQPEFVLTAATRARLTPVVVEQIATDTDSAIELVEAVA